MPELFNKIKQITIIGAGSWGTAIAKVIAENNPGTIVRMWSYEKSTANSINIKNHNPEFLHGIKLPYNIKATNNLKESLFNTEAVIIATPSKAIPDIIQKLSILLKDDIPLAYLTKGFCRINNEILTISQTISKLFPRYQDRAVGISGPSHAEEVARYFQTTLCVAGHNSINRQFFCDLLNCDYLQCRETEDIIGVDLGGTLKNPAAIAVGMISMFPGCGDNLTGALIAESLKEIIKLGTFLGAKTETIIDISGTGDLVATALSDYSRNRRFGKDIANEIIQKGTSISFTDRIYLRFKPEYVLEKMGQKFHYLAEGAYAIEPLIELAEKNLINIPVYKALYEVLLNKKEPSLLIETIKNPDLFDEIYHNAKMNVKDKKKGLEKLRGKAFKKIIINELITKFKAKNDPSKELFNSVINDVKLILQEKKGQGDYFLKNEMPLLTDFITKKSERTLKRIINLYLKETMDHYNPIFYRLSLKLLTLKYYWSKLKGYRNEITVTGDFDNLHSLRNNVNTIYVAKFKNLNDIIYYSHGIRKYLLPVPRTFISSDIVRGKVWKYLTRKCGGFIIHLSKLNNLLYMECVMEYLSILASHGVPFLYFPELHGMHQTGSKLDDNFFNMLTRVMYRETTEIALIPAEISYKNRLDESETKSYFTEAVGINFSSPVFLSEFTRKSSLQISISDLVTKIWTMDEIILPHFIICGILYENEYIIRTSKLKKAVIKYISVNRIILHKSFRSIINEGVRFLLKNSVIIKKDNYYMSLKHDIIKKYADIIKNKESVSINSME